MFDSWKKFLGHYSLKNNAGFSMAMNPMGIESVQIQVVILNEGLGWAPHHRLKMTISPTSGWHPWFLLAGDFHPNRNSHCEIH